jgi:hypothetical protein
MTRIRKILSCEENKCYKVEEVTNDYVVVRTVSAFEVTLRQRGNRFEKLGASAFSWVPIDGDEYDALRKTLIKEVL